MIEMTATIKFEALIVSKNLAVLREVLEILEDLSAKVDVCMSPARAVDILHTRNVNLLVLDCDLGNGAAEIMKQSGKLKTCRPMSIVALVDDVVSGKDIIQAGANVLIFKPLTRWSRNDFCKHVYARMVKEWHLGNRYAVRLTVVAKDAKGRSVPITITNISKGGIGMSHCGGLLVADILHCRLCLPGTTQIIEFDARVRWTTRDDKAGANFATISALDDAVLCKWLQQKRQGNMLKTEESTPFGTPSSVVPAVVVMPRST
jgi:CheY-like chemotaxis protein